MRRRIGLKLQINPHQHRWKTRRKYYRGLTKKQNIWIEKRLFQKAQLKLKTTFCIDPKDIEFKWCQQCQGAFINCPECNNNTCNGGSDCGLCYQYEKLALNSHGWSSTNEVSTEKIKIIKPEEELAKVLKDWLSVPTE